MRLEYSITGTFTVPDGTTFVEGSENLLKLPTGEIISVHPIFELESHDGADDHHDLDTVEAKAFDILFEDYDRHTEEAA